MKRLLTVVLVAIVLVFSTGLTVLADAPEVMTATVDLSIYTGQQLVGEAVFSRDPSTTITEFTFSGTLDGVSATAKGTATETWQGDKATVTILSFTEWDMPLYQPPVGVQAELSSSGHNLTVGNAWTGIPIYVSETVKAPESGAVTTLEVKGTPFTNLVARVYPVFERTYPVFARAVDFIRSLMPKASLALHGIETRQAVGG